MDVPLSKSLINPLNDGDLIEEEMENVVSGSAYLEKYKISSLKQNLIV